MLLQLRIENLATIRELDVEFTKGFSILTGETGAGKSIMIDAIMLALGHRGDPAMIRTGEEQTVVEAIFSLAEDSEDIGEFNIRRELEESGIALDDEIIVRCVVAEIGRQKRYINGNSVTADFLKKIGRQLINIHGQHDNQSLFQISTHLDFLDGYGQLLPLRKQVEEVFRSLQDARKEQNEFQKIIAEREFRLEELKVIIEDLSELNYQPSEEMELRKDENRLTHVEKLSMLLGQVRHQLQEMDGSVLEQLEMSRKLLAEAEQIDPECSEIQAGIETACFQLEDSHRDILNYCGKVEADPQRLSWINERLSRIQQFVRKFRLSDAEELLTLHEESIKEFDSLQQLDDNEQQLVEKIILLSTQLQQHAEHLSKQRRKHARHLDHAIVDELRQLGMNKARFETQIVSASMSENNQACSANGIDKVEFLLSVNPGQGMRSLVKVASGGELSRIMLALKTVLTSLDSVEILIFDEVDSGISGGVAEIVGQKLRQLGSRHQTLCVTHLPQIAAFAEHHFLVSKDMEDNQTFTKINPLNTESERVHALADLIGGQEITTNTMELAGEMLRSFQSKSLITEKC
jgi:DNA repair protein RecN (Recombination protein N)